LQRTGFVATEPRQIKLLQKPPLVATKHALDEIDYAPESEREARSASSLKQVSALLISHGTRGSKARLECVKEQRKSQPDRWFTRIVPAPITADQDPFVTK